MKNFMKKISKSRLFAVVLAIVLIASVATVAMAAEEDPAGETKGVEKGTYDTNYTVTTVKSVKSGSVVVGAVLQIIDSKGAVVEEWTTTKDDHVITSKLVAGAKYTLHEKRAPK